MFNFFLFLSPALKKDKDKGENKKKGEDKQPIQETEKKPSMALCRSGDSNLNDSTSSQTEIKQQSPNDVQIWIDLPRVKRPVNVGRYAHSNDLGRNGRQSQMLTK